MESLITAELRWFFPGAPNPSVWETFRGFPGSGQEARTDYYLRFGESSNAGVKLREGRLEAKVLVRDLGVWSLASGAAEGRAEVWEKREIPLRDLQISDAERTPDWIVVEKRRITNQLEEAGKTARSEQSTAASGVCRAEIAEVRVEDLLFWTIGFEADDADANSLRRAAERVIGDTSLKETGGRPTIERSMSYPAWLQSLQLLRRLR